ncbi:hypothetical protein [Flavobacterium psychrophilum]|uniref:hypothetical protein n=1 Tax=Flavobacterium psychrophilum TaxID=96345 RepID=UPI000B7C0E0B|nr:hypothetical protein [Flavobacterium psychrophilum]SNA88445.1 putative lipoprotein [Flavobacterium psychrophilum]
MKKLILPAIALALSILGCSSDEQNVYSKPLPDQNLATQAPVTQTPATQTTVGNTTVLPQLSDTEMGRRSWASLKPNPEIFYKSVDIEELTTNKAKFTIDFLKQFITIQSMSPSSLINHVFNEEDLRYVVIHDFNYDRRNNKITFKTSYKGIISTLESVITFDSNVYYRHQITINTDYVSKHYMRGIYEDIGGATDELLMYDHNKYSIDYERDSRFKDDYSDYLRFSFEVTDNIRNQVVARLSSDDIRGFKKLDLIGTEMKVFWTPSLVEVVREKISTLRNLNPNDLDLTDRLSGIFESQKWMMRTRIEVNDNQLTWRDDYLSGRGLRRDIYLKSPRFVLESAIRNGNDLKFRIKFEKANDQSITDAYFEFVLQNVM